MISSWDPSWDPSWRGEYLWNLLVLRPLFGETFERVGIVKGVNNFKHRASKESLNKLYNEIPVADYFIV
jgi:hypothetical protein